MNITYNDAYLLYNLLIDAEFSEHFAPYIVAQAAHETANFSSKLFTRYFNPFGMKNQGQQEASGTVKGYATYANYTQAVLYYKRLFRSWGLVSFNSTYGWVATLRDVHYFTAPFDDYLAGVDHFYNLYFPLGWKDKTVYAEPENASWSKQVHGAGGTW